VKSEAPPRIETPPERAAPPAPAIGADRVPAPKPPAVAPSVSPPPMAATAPQPGFVDPKAVNAIVRSHADEAGACYERAMMEHPDLHGRLTIHAVLDPNGRVASVSPTSSISDGARLQSCLVRAFRSWAFPRPAGGVNGNVTYSFSFESP
jgi:outer membrane biosynthesis protein TonB